MTVFKSNLDDISNTPYKDKTPFMIHHNTEKILAVSLTDMETSINPQQIVHNNFDGHQANAEQTITEPFCMDLGRKLESIQQGGQMVSSYAALRTPYGSNNVEQPLDLSPANSPRTAPPKSPTTHNVEVGKPDSSPNTEIQDHHRNTTSPEKWIPTENHSMLEAGSYQIPGRHISPNTSPSLNSEHGVSTTKLSPVLLPPSPFQSSSSNSPTASPGGLSHGGEGLSKRYKYEPILPPCQVCGDNASGYHYGANTCEACKAFFRRALQRKTKFKCVTGGNCEVRQGRGFTCAYCRFQKCNQLGMSLTAIKRGRYTHAKKAENIREVKRLQQMKHGDVPMMLSPVDSVQGDLTPEPIHSAQQNSQPIQQNFNHPMPDGSNPIQQFHIQNSDVSKALRCREEELEALIKEISDSHRKFFGDFSEMRRQLPAIEARYLEQRMQKEKLFGKLPTIQFSDYRQIWNEAGIAVDSRQEILVERMLPCIQQTITKIIQFARALPGFRQLSCEDQVALIKGSRTENWFIGEHKCYNTREGLYTNSVRCETVDMNDMAKIAGSLEVVQAIFKIATRLQQCYLTDEEIALYKAVAIMQRDRTASEEGATVCEDSQNNLMEALQYLVNKNHPNDPTLLARMLMILTDLRSMERQRGEELAKMCMLNINQKFPPAVLQFMNLAPLE